MKSIVEKSVLFAVCLALLVPCNNAFANVYASQLKVTNPDGSPFDGNFSDGTGAQLSFFLNDTASVVTVTVKEVQSGATVATIDAGGLDAGPQSVEWDGTGSEAGKQYVFEVTAEQPTASSTDWTLFFDSGDINIFTRGVAVVTDQSDPNFGLIFTSNDGGPLGTGINIYNPDGSFHDPFLVAKDLTSGGSINYGTDAPLFAILDYRGRLYVSLKDLGQVMRINRDFTAEVVIDGLSFPKGLYVEGTGEDFTIYVAADNKILRGKLGTAASIQPSAMETLANFSGFSPRQVILDDDGFLYVTLRVSNDLGSDGKGIRKYDISGTLPVTDDDALWFLMEDKTFIANDLAVDRGTDLTSSADDILYFVTRAGDGNDQDGIWRIDDINSVFPDVVRIITEDALYGGDQNVQARATIDFDAAGNLIFMENANEHVFFVSPPSASPGNSFTTTSAETLTVSVPTSVASSNDFGPTSYRLEPNYPNPFNPSTTVTYRLARAGMTTVKIYNLKGQAIRSLVDRIQPAGDYSIVWDGKDDAGKGVVSGVYILVLKSGDFAQSRRMTLLK
ncbi:MAG: FlgD immunoglobulin-like domain containing protein [bacterium]